MKILLIEPYLSTSHAHWARMLCRFLEHDVKLLSLPGRHWKWRMHHAALHFAQELQQMTWKPDVLIISEMMDLALFKSLIDRPIPIILYFHENQLTYPRSLQDSDSQHQRDNHYGFINFTSALVADHVIFNSRFHLHNFLTVLTPFLDQFPDQVDSKFVDDIRQKSSVISPGINVKEVTNCRSEHFNLIPIILWNHRWEYDKDPDLFFRVLLRIQEAGKEFSLVILGGNPEKAPPIFAKARLLLDQKILQYGYVKDRATYLSWLWKSDLVLSTSKQDFFGISMVEAMYCDCTPLMPDRLAFPDHLPEDLHHRHLYSSENDLYDKLVQWIDSWSPSFKVDNRIRAHLLKYDAQTLSAQYEAIFRKLF